MQKHRLLEQALPSLFPFSLPPPLFAPATQAKQGHINRAFHIYEYLQGGSKVVEKFFMLFNITALLVGLVA